MEKIKMKNETNETKIEKDKEYAFCACCQVITDTDFCFFCGTGFVDKMTHKETQDAIDNGHPIINE